MIAGRELWRVDEATFAQNYLHAPPAHPETATWKRFSKAA